MKPGPSRDFVISGLPRSGTTHLSAALHRPSSVVTLSDPDGVWRRFYPEHGDTLRRLGLGA